MAKFANITGWGKCMPPAVMTNDDMATVLDTSDEWIKSRSGISERRVSHVPVSDLASVAGQRALAAAGYQPEDVDLLIVATCTPDTVIPSTAAHVQKKMGAANAAVFDLNAGCSGFIYSLEVATAMIRAAGYKRVLIIGAERITWFLNWSLRDTAVLFGDGAGAVLVEPSDEECGLLASHLGCEGDALEALLLPNFGTAGNRFVDDYAKFDVSFDGREIFRRAVRGMAQEITKVLDDLGLSNDDIDIIIPHQANARIIESLANHLSVPMSQVALNIQNYGNTSAATIPVALCELLEDGRIKHGNRLLLAAFGAGLTRGAGMIRWGDRVTPLAQSDAELPPCDQTALEIMSEAIKHTG
ncbi:MAG: ketoacyl-ACP synthase III [Xanthomonadales bacterium]|nr:ketoacyl-ACP synthase III [Gammaproteobacteria bacterium]MBT8054008.1 ketoacyl-ACP synthase III [Gammaproteobacteria bacterium]NND56982.1 ketoacyl-ACP synthase III [Xanthomonadales bacterium]NNK51940.1 ketoacyl-ACP synthase III [Xanthomonadales bacterium]